MFALSDLLKQNGDFKYNKFVSMVTFIRITIDIMTDGIWFKCQLPLHCNLLDMYAWSSSH